ncbi:MAG: hypothetical protein ACREEM_36325, partial [Blastocatellia bacterium]
NLGNDKPHGRATDTSHFSSVEFQPHGHRTLPVRRLFGEGPQRHLLRARKAAVLIVSAWTSLRSFAE